MPETTTPNLPAAPSPITPEETSLHGRIEACHEQFVLHFVGQPRLTRDVAMLDSLIAELTPLAEQLPVTEHGLRKEVMARLDDYHAERHAIVTSQERAGTKGRAAAHLKLRVGFVMHRYVRHFAGQPRATRDLGLLREIVTDLADLVAPVKHLSRLEDKATTHHHPQDNAAALAKVLQALHQSQTQLSAEADAIAAMRKPVPAGIDEPHARSEALRLAQAANTIFSSYQGLVIGRPRLVVRPELIARLAQDLASVHAGMQAIIDAGWQDAGHKDNCRIMADHHRQWLEEHQETVNLRRQHTMDEIAHALAQEADTILAAYNQDVAGQQLVPERRHTLTMLCDRMDELQRQIQSVPHTPGHHHHEHNAWLITDALTMLNGTYDGTWGHQTAP